jgi:6-phosphogluconolactonase
LQESDKNKFVLRIMIVKSYSSAEEAAKQLTEALLAQMQETPEKPFSMAISGGKNPALLFRLWANDYKTRFPWKRIQLYWVDERCVPPTDTESNFLMTKTNLLDAVPLREQQIFRIHGEADPSEEAIRYTELVKKNLSEESNLPVFDCILLGVGPDGHTSSVFPGQEQLYKTTTPYIKNAHPQTKQVRVALMPRTILKARLIFFFATGAEKADILKSVIAGDEHLPAGFIAKHATNATLFTTEFNK